MNFLAHLTLSNNNDDLLIGNFIADSTRSAEYPKIKPGIIKGIELHHKIDEFTDSHPIVEQSKARLRRRHGKYAGVIVDIFYDHYLAKNYTQYSSFILEEFAQRCYQLFDLRQSDLSKGTQRMLPYMKKGNWLVNYARLEGMRKVFSGMSRRASFKNNMATCVDDLEAHYGEFQKEFEEFYPQLQAYVAQEIVKMPSS